MRPRKLVPALAALLLAPVAAAQHFDSVTLDPANPVHAESCLVLHDDGTDLQAFSAFDQTWQAIAPSGQIVVGTGDFCALTRTPGFAYQAWSARRNVMVPAPALGPFTHVRVEDDVILLVDSGAAAHAFSAHTGTWASIPVFGAIPPANVATSRFVAGVLDGNTLNAFAARTGTWAAFAAPTVLPPLADGNTLVADITTGGGQRALAFSGVLGVFATSPLAHGTNVTLLDHDVAFMRGDAAVGWRDVGYSAYEGVWVPSPHLHPAGINVTVSLTDKVVFTEEPGMHFAAFGTRPAVWDNLPGSFALFDSDEDLVIIDDLGGTLLGFSGLSVGVFVPAAFTSPVNLGAIGAGEYEHVAGIQDPTAGLVRAFSPANNAWSPAAPTSTSAIPVFDDAVGMVIDPGSGTPISGYGARNNAWANGIVPSATATFDQSGSVLAVLDGTDVAVWNERCGSWDTFSFLATPTAYLGRNYALLDSGTLDAWSLHRQELVAAPTSVAYPLGSVVTEENVAHFTDAAGLLWAFGSPGEVQMWHQYPNGTEVRTFDVVAAPTFLDYSVQADPGDLVLSMWSLNPTCPPAATALGPLWLAGPLNVLGVSVAPGDFHAHFPLPAVGVTTFDLWFQAAVFDGVVWTLTNNADPAWLY